MDRGLRAFAAPCRLSEEWGPAALMWIKPGAGSLQIHSSPAILCPEPLLTLPPKNPPIRVYSLEIPMM
jgi:hypothetical protein